MNYTKSQVEQVARMYRTDMEAARAMGFTRGRVFCRICKGLDVETPNERREREATLC